MKQIHPFDFSEFHQNEEKKRSKPYWMISISILVVSILGGCIADIENGHNKQNYGTVVKKTYVPYSTARTTGYDSKGRMFTATTTIQEEWKVIVSSDEGTVEIKTDAENWMRCAENESIHFESLVGKWTGIEYYRTIK